MKLSFIIFPLRAIVVEETARSLIATIVILDRSKYLLSLEATFLYRGKDMFFSLKKILPEIERWKNYPLVTLTPPQEKKVDIK